MKIAIERSHAVLAQHFLIHLLLLSTSLLVIIGFGVFNDFFDGSCDKYDAGQGYLLNAEQFLTGELVRTALTFSPLCLELTPNRRSPLSSVASTPNSIPLWLLAAMLNLIPL